MIKTVTLSMIALLSTLTIGANAAGIDVRSRDVTASLPESEFCLNMVDTITSGLTSAECVSGPTTVLRTGGIGFGRGFADIITGELKTEASGTAANLMQESSLNALGQATIAEIFTVSGSGTARARLGVEGVWDVSSFGPVVSPFQIQASVLLTGGSISGVSDNIFITADMFAGTIDELLTVETFVQDGDDVVLIASLLAQFSGHGSIDFSNTAELFLETSDGVSVTFADPAFLSNPAFVVPLPAALPLFASALVGLGFVGWRRRKNH